MSFNPILAPQDSHPQSQISGLREQIKSNAGLLFPHGANVPVGPQIAYDIVIMTYTADEALASTEKRRFQALLTYASGIGDARKANVAARGQPSDDAISALEALLLVTATALEKYQGNVCKEAVMPSSIAFGLIDEALIHGRSWKSIFRK